MPDEDDEIQNEESAAMSEDFFGGKPGEPVPEVDPEDVKTIWQIGEDTKARNPGKNVATGLEVFRQACRPGADIEAVYYRASLMWMMTQIAPQVLERLTRDGRPDDAVFRAAAKVPAEWMAVGIPQEELPFDVNEFLRLCGETV